MNSSSIFSDLKSNEIPKGSTLPKNFKNLDKVQKTAEKEITLAKHGKIIKITVL